MYEVDLHLEPNEASDLCPVFDRVVLEREGWDRAFVTVLDEAPAKRAVAVLGHEEGAGQDTGWHALRMKCKPSRKGKTEDAEACARREGWIYVLGSQFGSKDGPLEPRRSWIARVREEQLATGLSGKRPRLELARLRFGLHRAINDALAGAAVDLLELGPRTRKAYIDQTIARGAAKDKRWAGRVTSADHPVNVEGAAFRANGRMLLGLRYPVTAAGQAILVELHDVDAVFEDPDAVPRCSHVWVLEGVGSAQAPVGVRALHGDDADGFDAVVGNLDAAGKGAVILEDQPSGGQATSAHVRFTLPLMAGGGPVATRLVHDFAQLQRVEGLAVAPDGHVHYVVDEEGHVALRTVLVEDGAAPH